MPRRPCLRRVPAGLIVLSAALWLSGCAELGGKFTTTASGPEDVIESSTRAAAESAEASFDYQSAAVSWNHLRQTHLKDPNLALRLARDLRYSGQVQPAIDITSGFMEANGRSAPLLIELGKDYLAGDRLGLAVRTLRDATELAPTDWEVWSALGVAQDYQGNYADAQTAYARALTLSADNPVVLNNLGLSQAQAGQLIEARASLEKAVDQPKATAQVRQNLALIRALTGDLGGAERLNRQDLTADQVRGNAAYYRLLAGARIN
jgi:Flp pilus assembly protein TadD